jgi:hypothetical protein
MFFRLHHTAGRGDRAAVAGEGFQTSTFMSGQLFPSPKIPIIDIFEGDIDERDHGCGGAVGIGVGEYRYSIYFHHSPPTALDILLYSMDEMFQNITISNVF